VRFPQQEPEPRRIIPALPDADPVLGEIRWDRWEEALCLTHVDGSCVTCAFPGPLRVARGMTWYTPEPTYVRVRRSSRRDGRASKWVKARHEPYWCYTHWASRCPACDEMFVYRMYGGAGREKEWVEIAYHPYTTERAVPPTDDDVLF